MSVAYLCQIEWYLTGMTPGASSWNFCSIFRRWPPLDILMRLWNTAAYGSPCRDLHRTCASQLSMPQEHCVTAHVIVPSQISILHLIRHTYALPGPGRESDPLGFTGCIAWHFAVRALHGKLALLDIE